MFAISMHPIRAIQQIDKTIEFMRNSNQKNKEEHIEELLRIREQTIEMYRETGIKIDV